MNIRKASVGMFLILLLFLWGCSSGVSSEFAQCLTMNDVKMFGAYWCPHCNTQKQMFGKGWQYVNYVECSLPNRAGETEICRQENIDSYPTWEFADGTRITGVLSLEQLAERSGCSLPE